MTEMENRELTESIYTQRIITKITRRIRGKSVLAVVWKW